MWVHGQVRGDPDFPFPPPPGQLLEKIFFGVFVLGPGGVRIIVALPDEFTSL